MARILTISDSNQSPLLYNYYLPYWDKLEEEAEHWLTEIKDNLGRAVLLRCVVQARGKSVRNDLPDQSL